MHDVLCVYYSRTGRTRAAMEEIAQALDGELVELSDGVDRSGWRGWLRSGRDAMRKSCRPVRPVKTQRPLSAYSLVILGTPVWAGRCSSVMRAFLKKYGPEVRNAAYLITRSGAGKCEEVYEQMDLYIPNGHLAAGSLRPGSVGYEFWKEEFLRQARELLEKKSK